MSYRTFETRRAFCFSKFSIWSWHCPTVLYDKGREWTGHDLLCTRLLFEQLLGRSVNEPLLGCDEEIIFDLLGDTLVVILFLLGTTLIFEFTVYFSL